MFTTGYFGCCSKELDGKWVPTIWGMVEQIMIGKCNGICYAIRNDKRDGFTEAQEDMQKVAE